MRDLDANLVTDSGMASSAQHWNALKIMLRHVDKGMNLDGIMVPIQFEEVQLKRKQLRILR